MQIPQFFTRPLTIGELLDWTIRIYRTRFGLLILTTALFFVPLGLLSGVFTGQTMTGYLNIIMSLIQDPSVEPDAQLLESLQANENFILFFYLLIVPLSLVGTGITNLALAHQGIGSLHNQDISLGDGLRMGLRRFWTWLGMSIAMGFAFVGLVIALMIVFVIIGFGLALVFGGFAAFESAAQGGDSGVAALAGIVVGIICFYALIFVAFFGPFLYLYARWCVAIPGIIDQRWGPIGSLQESWALTRGNVWRCIGFNLLLSLFYGVIYTIFMGLAFALSALVITNSALASIAVFAATSTILPILWQPIQSVAYVMLYFDLRVRNESYDLEVRIDQLEQETIGTNPTGTI